jgi:hypothetical protein
MIAIFRQLGFGRRYRLGLALAAAGGASRYNEDLQTVVRLAAILGIAMSLWPLEFASLWSHRGFMIMVAAVYALLAVQLVPLPPELWAALPGHALYAQIADAAGQVTWRPLSLTPDLTLNALFALLPATAAGIGVCYLDFRSRVWLAYGIVAVAMMSAALGFLQANAGGEAFHFYRQSSADSPVGLFANRNHQAALLACALPFIGAMAGIKVRDGFDGRKALGIALAVAIVLLFGLVSTGSRMGLLLAAIGIGGALACFRASGHRLLPRRWPARFSVGGIGIVSVAVVGFAALRGGAIARLAATDSVSDTRAAMITPLLTTAHAFLPIGAGFGSFNAVYRQFEPASLLSTIYMNEAHDEVLQLAIEGGVPALLLLALFLFWWARTGFRVVITTPAGRRRTFALAALTSTMILMASSLVDYPLRTPLLGALFVICCIEMARGATVGERSADGF